MKRYCLTLDLKDDPKLIAEYEAHHQAIWPAIHQSIRNSGIVHMEIYRLGIRLFMILETDERFSFEEKEKADAANSQVQEWERLMWQYQQPLPLAKPGEKWMLMNKIFEM